VVSAVESNKDLWRIIEGGFEDLAAVVLESCIFLRKNAMQSVQRQLT
jgi:hypothetical protein